MAATTETKLSLKLLVNRKTERVLFAEAGKDFVDFLFNIMSLPIGTTVRLLMKQGMVGSLGVLYESIEKLSDVYMQPHQHKGLLLNPKVLPSAGDTSLPRLLPDIESYSLSNNAKAFYRCPRRCNSASLFNSASLYVADDPTAVCPQCRCTMSDIVQLVKVPPKTTASSSSVSSSSNEGGYVKGVVTYMVMDDLMVMPMSTISSIAVLNKLNVKDMSDLEEQTFNFGMDEALKLLKASLHSKTVLTDIFFGKSKVSPS